ncbi:transporter substrate-binding domain-containing protein [Rossellomorea oryzaecorticis]|uniref:Transporter substrate-binding domain-containing protein n=1 Tax=Rossellomorea oryzaecorticis TaxID=1396505 RepID=A0ABW8VRT9_9BACI|nr:transporter substrate-binding domain-containing protein [[Bacillus] enclensis]MBH9968395.1 transporter substrate-binding domain-containing protein [[Bacillus] enclensis]
MKKLLILSLALLLSAGLAACGSKESSTASGDSKKLIMGTSADYKPFEYVDTANSDQFIGYDIDLANKLADELGYEVEIKDMEFSGLITALKTGQVDFVLSAMTPTPERKKNVDFSEVYYTAKNMIITKTDSGISSEKDLDGKTVGVQLGSIQQDEAEGMQSSIDLKVETRDRIPELIQDLQNGRFDAIIIENTVAAGYLDKNNDLQGSTMKVNEEEAGSAIAFPKDSELTEEFNAALKKLEENGELDKLAEKWFNG